MVIPCIDMKIILIGAGNLATQLAVALQKKGMTPAYIYSRTRESAEQLSERLHDVPCSIDISRVPTDGDLYIFAVKDSALLDLVSRMPSNRGLWVHTAGSMDMEVFAPYTARYGVFYPMQTFSKERVTDFDDIPIFVEANHTDDTERLQELAGRLSTKVYEATSEQRKYLHLAAVFACNFTNHLYALCDHILSEHGLPFETMLPLIRETAAKVADMPPAQAQTGPAIRYDKNVIDKQIALLSDPTMRQIYDLMSRSIHETNKHNDYEPNRFRPLTNKGFRLRCGRCPFSRYDTLASFGRTHANRQHQRRVRLAVRRQNGLPHRHYYRRTHRGCPQTFRRIRIKPCLYGSRHKNRNFQKMAGRVRAAPR